MLSESRELRSDRVQNADRRGVSGKTVVASMFLLGICATTFLYTYWSLHLMPFMPLQEAIVREFPGSAPRVNGGQAKLHRKTKRVLSIQMKTTLDPKNSEKDAEALKNLRARVAVLVRQHTTLPDIEEVQLHLYKLIQEEEIRQASWKLAPGASSDWEPLEEPGVSLKAAQSVQAAPEDSTDSTSP